MKGEVNAQGLSFSGHLRFDDEDLLEELEEIGLENIIMLSALTGDKRIADIEEVPFEDMHRKYKAYFKFRTEG